MMRTELNQQHFGRRPGQGLSDGRLAPSLEIGEVEGHPCVTAISISIASIFCRCGGRVVARGRTRPPRGPRPARRPHGHPHRDPRTHRAPRRAARTPADFWAETRLGAVHATVFCRSLAATLRPAENKAGKGRGPAQAPLKPMFEMIVGDDFLAEEFAEIVAVLARSSRILSGADVPARDDETSLRDRPDLIYDVDWNEEERLAEWQDVIASTRDLPVVLRAATRRAAARAWLGPLLVRAARVLQPAISPACISAPKTFRESNGGTQSLRSLVGFSRCHPRGGAGGVEGARPAGAGKKRDGAAAKEAARRLEIAPPRRTRAARPIVSTGMIQDRLKISKQGALNLVGELSLREMTGRGRLRAWGIV